MDPAPGLAHVSGDVFGGKKLVLEVDRHGGVPTLGCGVLDLVALVVGRVIQQHGDRAKVLAHRVDATRQGGDVGQIGQDKQRRVLRLSQALGQRGTGLSVDVQKTNPRALSCELLDQAGAYAGSTAGNQHGSVAKAGVMGEGGHGL